MGLSNLSDGFTALCENSADGSSMVECMGLGIVEDNKRPSIGLGHLMMKQNIQFSIHLVFAMEDSGARG